MQASREPAPGVPIAVSGANGEEVLRGRAVVLTEETTDALRFFFHPCPRSGGRRPALNAFLAANSVLSVERHFVADGANSFWSIGVGVATESTSEAKSRGKRGVDYREILSPEHFAIYARLRTLRNKLAEEQGTPPYAIFTNEQLATMAQLTEISRSAWRPSTASGRSVLRSMVTPFLHNWEVPVAKTRRIHLDRIGDWHNVAWALARACRGKRSSVAAQRLLARADETIAGIGAALRTGSLPVGKFRAFVIHDPKRRVIHAAPLEDRIAHHALVRHLEPVLEPALLPSVFACRRGKGVHAAIHYAQRQARRFPWVMHLDITAYFPSIDHAILRRQLTHRFRGDGLQLIHAVIDAHGAEEGRGLPIGALTSQHFANHYLNVADRWALSQPEVRAHSRYMDDFLLWGDNRLGLVRLRDRFTEYLAGELALSVKPPLIQRSDQGVCFCGIHIRPHSLRASQRRRRRYRRALEHWQAAWRVGDIDDLGLQRAHDAARAILLPADDPAWRAQCVHLGGVLDV